MNNTKVLAIKMREEIVEKPLSQAEIARRLKVSKARISQIFKAEDIKNGRTLKNNQQLTE